MRFAGFIGISLGFAVAAATPGLAQPIDRAVPQSPSAQPEHGTPPAQPHAEAPSTPPGEISHEEMVREQERRDREAEAERDRDDQ